MFTLNQLPRLVLLCLLACVGIGCKSTLEGPSVDIAYKKSDKVVKAVKHSDVSTAPELSLSEDKWKQGKSSLWKPIEALEFDLKLVAAVKATQTLVTKFRASGASQ